MTDKHSTSGAKAADDPIVDRVGARERLREQEEVKSKKTAKRSASSGSMKGKGKRG
jgi:hypothetical protein